MDFPQDFRCPISMELMKDPVTISTGVTYERKNIEKWFYSYNKKVCPATMQLIDEFDITPNHTLKNLITSWSDSKGHRIPCLDSPFSAKHDELVAILGVIESTPFKVSLLRKLNGVLRMGDEIVQDFKRSGGVEALVNIIMSVLDESSDFSAFRACEEALSILHQVAFTKEDEIIVRLLMKPQCIKALAIMLQRGGEEARFCTVSTFQKMSRADYQWKSVAEEVGADFYKSLLEILSDENCTKSSNYAMQLLIEIMDSSKKSRLHSIEAGGVCTLIELLPDSNRKKCEKILHLIKLLCECAEGRLALVEHGLGIAAVSKKLLNVSNIATKTAAKIFWLISGFHTSERVLDEMMVCGAVTKLVALLHFHGAGGGGRRSATKEKVARILKFHSGTWRRYPCFPSDLNGSGPEE